MPSRIAPRIMVAALVAATLSLVATARAADPAVTCANSKRKAAALKSASKLKCAAQAAGKGATIDPDCLSKAEAKFQSAFAKAEATGGCLVTGDASSVEGAVDGCVSTLRTFLGVSASPEPLSKCAAKKLGAAGKKLAGKIGCYTRALQKSVPVDGICLTKAEGKFGASFVKADAGADCVTHDDAASIETKVDACLSSILASVATPTTTTTASTTSTTTVTSSTTTTTAGACADTEPAAFAGVTAEHNDVRANATPTPVPALSPLCWSNALAADAQAWANGCSYAHDPTLGALDEGQNIYASANSDGTFSTTAAQDSVPSWASEAADYDYTSNTCAPTAVCGHYTQLVWRSTALVGCGIKHCTTGSPFPVPPYDHWTFVVCNYSPPGNFVGERPY